MQRTHLQEKEYSNLLNRIVPIMLEKGLKATTMDTVAASLGMSKRTLYEIFESKSEMIREALGALDRQNQQSIAEAFASSDNVMEALIRIFRRHRDLVGVVNVEFYRDMDRLYKKSREDYNKSRECHHARMLPVFERGVSEGMFRPDVDYEVQSRIMVLEMEAMKRIEELFPPHISMRRVFDSIMVGFLRSIASEKGMRILDNYTKELNKEK